MKIGSHLAITLVVPASLALGIFLAALHSMPESIMGVPTSDIYAAIPTVIAGWGFYSVFKRYVPAVCPVCKHTTAMQEGTHPIKYRCSNCGHVEVTIVNFGRRRL